ncbi:hypothetical protein ES708_24317 [subsurface metagenome]
MIQEDIFSQDVGHVPGYYNRLYVLAAVVFSLDEPVQAVAQDQLPLHLVENDRGNLAGLLHAGLELLPQLGVEPGCHPGLGDLHVIDFYAP